MARTDGDSWDLLNSVGATATAVAAQRAVATNRADPLISDPLAEPLLEALGADYYRQFARGELAGDAGDLGELRAMVDSIAIRTRYFDDFFLEAMNAGVRQAVILASGLDTRAYRLPWVAGSTVFEVDQPEVIEFKTATLSGLGVRPPVRHRPLAVDLRHDWPAALRAAGFDPGAPAAWIAEGLLIYLPPEAGEKLFDDVDTLSGPGSRIATEDIAGITGEQLAKISGRMKTMRDGTPGEAPSTSPTSGTSASAGRPPITLRPRDGPPPPSAPPRCSESTAWHCPKAGSPRSATRST